MRRLSRRNSLAGVLILGLMVAGALAVEAEPRKRPTGPVVAHHADAKRAGATDVRVENIKVWDHAGEPTLGANPGGDIFYVAANISGEPNGAGPRLPNQVHVFKTENEGDSWTDISPMAGPARRHTVTLDPYIFVDDVDGDNARIFNIDLTVACSLLSYSDDNGETWTTNPIACGRPVNDHHTVFAGPPTTSSPIGYPHVVYYCWNDVATSSCSKSIDGGITWAPTGRPPFAGLDDSADLCGGLHGHGVVGKDGTVYVPREYCGRPMIAMSKDEGLSWTIVQTAKMRAVENALLDPSVAVDDKGNIYYTFVGEADRLPYITYSRNGGKSWSKPLMIGAPGVKEANLATLDAGGPGKVAVAYMGSTNVKITKGSGDDPDERNHDKATWNAYLTASTDVFAKNPVFVTGQVNKASDPVKTRACGPGRCGSVFDFIDVIVAPDGTPWAAFVDACTEFCAEAGGGADFGDEAFVGHLVGLRLR